MALADRLEDAPTKPTGKPCSVGALLDRLAAESPDEHKALRAMLFELGWSQAKIEAACAKEGYTVGLQTINRHRSRACRCFKAAG